MKGGFFKKHPLITEEKNKSFSSNLPVLQKDKQRSKSNIFNEATDSVASLKIVLVADWRDRQLGGKDEASGLQEFNCE